MIFDLPTRNYVRTIVGRFVRLEQDVEDLTQDALLRAHQYRNSFRGECAYRSWLYRVTVTAALDFIRRRGRIQDGEDVADELACPRNTRARVTARVDLAKVEIVVEQLGPRLEAVFWQSVRDGMTESEIAAAHGLTVPAVKARIHRAKQAVREALEAA